MPSLDMPPNHSARRSFGDAGPGGRCSLPYERRRPSGAHKKHPVSAWRKAAVLFVRVANEFPEAVYRAVYVGTFAAYVIGGEFAELLEPANHNQ